MRGVIVLVGLFLTVESASACHKFSIWRYPHPQRCPVRIAVVARAPMRLDTEDAKRQRAIETLKVELRKVGTR